MSREADVVARSERPVTTADVVEALTRVGVSEGAIIIVHSSLSQIGWVVGGAQTVVLGLREAVGHAGTLVMPAQTGVSDPSTWMNPPVPSTWWPAIRDAWPAFDARLTPLRGMGAIVECFARLPDSVHSGHPALGFVSAGPQAAQLMHPHPLEAGLADGSPLGRLYDADARIVLIGVGHGNNTSLHLAEHRAEWPGKAFVTQGAPLSVDGVRRWVEYHDLDRDDEDFEALGAAFEAHGGLVRRAPLGLATVVSCAVRQIVDFAVPWLAAHRGI